MEDKRLFIYDIEILKNVFTYTGLNVHTQEVVQFVIWKGRNDIKPLLEHLKQCKGMIGFNNLSFDYPVLHTLMEGRGRFLTLTGEKIAEIMHMTAQEKIGEEWSEVKTDEIIIPQLDLFRIWHFNNKARMTNLKKLEINMDFDNVQDMPYSHDQEITTQKQVDEILAYNLNDVKATFEFYKKTANKIALRTGLRAKYGLDCINYPDSKIGEQLMLKLYCEKTGLDVDRVKRMRTRRKVFHFADCIPPYIKFKTPEFNELLKYLKGISVHELKDSFKYEFEYKGLTYHYGTGGIHGCVKAGIYESDDEYIIVDCDVASLYPNLPITLGFYIEHLGEIFADLYDKDIVQPRLAAKKRGDKVMAEGFKLAANSVYGKSNSEYSFLFDPLYTLKTTLAGQLVLSMLAEMFLSRVPDLQIIQINTDGITVRMPKEHKRLYWDICKEWEKTTLLQLEYLAYSKMIIRDVNSYIAVALKDGKIKYKGAFRPKEVMVKEDEWHKDFSMDVVTQAVDEYFLKGTPVEKTIRENKNIYDFCKAFKATAGWKCETLNTKEVEKTYETTKGFYETQGWTEGEDGFYYPFKKGDIENLRITKVNDKVTRVDWNIKPEQKTNRYYISNNGKVFRKEKEGKIISIEASALVTTFNKYQEKPFEEYDINYQYYIDEAFKIIHIIDGTTERIEAEAKAKKEAEKRQKEEDNYLEFCMAKVPTQKQFDKYQRDWLIAKFGAPVHIKPSKVKNLVSEE